jgi:NADH-quinone oxidoreductase subunit J
MKTGVFILLFVALGLAGNAVAQPSREPPPELKRLQEQMRQQVQAAKDNAKAQYTMGVPVAPGGMVKSAPVTSAATDSPHRDSVEGSGAGMAIAFWLFAAITVGGALFVITRSNLIAAVMGMVGSFFGVAAVFMMLYASFLSVIQLLVYAGAIMVLFVFVIMVLNKPEDEPWGKMGNLGKILSVGGIGYLLLRLVSLVWSVVPSQTAMKAPADLMMPTWKNGQQVSEAMSWGSTRAVGTELFGNYLFPFEAISILLLVAVVGAIAIARPLKDDEPGADAGEGA